MTFRAPSPETHRQPSRAAAVPSKGMSELSLRRRAPRILVVDDNPDNIMLTVRGKAVEGGAMGDVVGVLNIQSNRTVQATVIGPGRVTIAAAGPLIASAARSASNDQDPPSQ